MRDPATGFVQNCNNAPWTTTATAADPQPAAFPLPKYHGDTDTERAWRVRQALTGTAPVSAEQARALEVETRMIAAAPLLPLLRLAWQTWGPGHPDADRLADPMAILDLWDGEPDILSTAPTLVLVWANAMFGKLMLDVEVLGWTEADVDEARGAAMLAALLEGMDNLEGFIGTWSIPWGLLHGVTLADGSRYPVASARYPPVSLFNCNVDPYNAADLVCRIGSAHTFFSVMTDPIRTWSARPLGQTDDPASPYFATMTELYAVAELKPLAFTDAELAAQTLTETVLEPIWE